MSSSLRFVVVQAATDDDDSWRLATVEMLREVATLRSCGVIKSFMSYLLTVCSSSNQSVCRLEKLLGRSRMSKAVNPFMWKILKFNSAARQNLCLCDGLFPLVLGTDF
mmetsp:Transcript_10177/g.13608  ORF Transcript_10177/g.13608 Transcript_10177/m.13608 type:complete len:108 (+) Transcript_10177:1873-2196(+)